MRWNMAVLYIIIFLFCSAGPAARTAESEPVAEKSTAINEVMFKGNSAFPEDRLRSVAGLKKKRIFSIFSRKMDLEKSDIRRMADELTLFYRRHGYFDVEVKPMAAIDGSVTVKIIEGEPCRVSQVNVVVVTSAGKPGPSAEEIKPVTGIAEGDIFTVDSYKAGRVALTGKLKDTGYPFAETVINAEIDVKNHKAVISYKVNTGAKEKFGDIIFKGIIHTEEKILRRAITFKPGGVYRQSLVDESREALYKMGLFESVVIKPGRDRGQGIVPVHVTVKEGRHRNVKASVGYSTDEGPRGMAGWETLRLYDKILSLGAEVRTSDLQTLATTYVRRPYVFNRNSSFLSDLSYSRLTEAKFTYRSLKARLGFDFQPTRRFTFSSFGAVERVLQVSPDRDLKKAIEEGARDVDTIASVAFSLTWNSTDKLFTPRSGSIVSLSMEPSRVLGTKVNFDKISLEGRHYFGFDNDMVLALRLGAGGIFSGSPADSIPLTRRFYAGGPSSIRGYSYNVLGPLTRDGVLIGGNGLVEASTELRFPVGKGFTGVTFVDAGNATPHPFSLRDAKIMSGAGFGIRYNSPVGPIGVDIAWKLVPYPLDRSPYMIHLFIGYAF